MGVVYKEGLVPGVYKRDQPKKWYRAALELFHQCDKIIKLSPLTELFSPENTQIRDKLRSYAERLIVPPCQFSRKGEDLIWKKVFYDVITHCRANKAHQSPGPILIPYRSHLMGAVGYYQHLLLKLQNQYGLNLCGVVDFAHRFEQPIGEVNEEEGVNAIHRCLLYLGDLARYQAETEGASYKALSARFYHQALLICPDEGRAHNQLGTLNGPVHEGLEAAYHYMRCLSSKNSFPGAGDNLKAIFNKNNTVCKDVMCSPESYPPSRRFLICFLLLADKLSGAVSMAEIDQLVRGLGADFADCYPETRGTVEPFSAALVLKIITMGIMLAENALAPGVDTVQPKLIPAFVVEIISIIITVLTARVKEKFNSPIDLHSLHIALDTLPDFGAQGTNGEENNMIRCLHMISSEPLLLSVKVFGDWLKVRHHLISQDLTAQFWAQLADLINLFPPQKHLTAFVKEHIVPSSLQQKAALPEDVAVRGLAPLSTLHNQLNYPPSTVELNVLEEYGLRLLCIKSLGTFAASLRPKPGLQHNPSNDIFTSLYNKAPESDNQRNRSVTERTMKAMAQQRLQMDVQALEYTVHHAPASQFDSLSPFLVPVTSTVCLHLRTVKLLVATQRSVIIIPQQVIQDLDKLKKCRENHYAREAIKYFESMFKNGNWWLRAQGEQEVVSLKEQPQSAEMAAFLNVLACCLYLANKSQGIVTLLVPDDAVSAAKSQIMCNQPNNYTGNLPTSDFMELSKRYGIRVEGALEFYSKWTMSNRHGKIGRGK